ncbi:sporulation histidine kinase inhibitor Sda [Paenibacillus sp. PvR148]
MSYSVDGLGRLSNEDLIATYLQAMNLALDVGFLSQLLSEIKKRNLKLE